MLNACSRDKLWHTPLTLDITVDGNRIVVPVDKRYISICKHRVQVGHSAELFRESNLAIVYTQINSNNASVVVQHEDNDIADVLIQGRGFEECLSASPEVRVVGLSKLAEAIIARHTTIPDIMELSTGCEVLPQYDDLKHCKRTIRAMMWTLPKPENVSQQHRVYDALIREKLLTVSDNARPPVRKRYTGLSGVHMLLKFNNNVISRMVSAHVHSSLLRARAMCVNAALMHSLVLPEQTVILGSTLETMKLKMDTWHALMTVADTKPVTRLSYLDENRIKRKMFMYVLTPMMMSSLKDAGITTRGCFETYVIFNHKNTPILMGDVTMPRHNALSPVQVAKLLTMKGEVFTRKWLFAACTTHPELEQALPLFSRACAPANGSIFAYIPVPALDIWTNAEIAV